MATEKQTSDDLLSFYASRTPEDGWFISAVRPTFCGVTDGCIGERVERLTGESNRSASLSLMMARASELNSEPDPDARYIVTGRVGGNVEIQAPKSWVGYLVTIEIAGEVWPVELEMDLETAKARALSWKKRGARIRAHSFAGDSYYTYTRLWSDCKSRRDKLAAMR